MADFTYVGTWQGFDYVAFIIAILAGVIGWWADWSHSRRYLKRV
ncbi:hypothetical protein [Citrobacter braakii]